MDKYKGVLIIRKIKTKLASSFKQLSIDKVFIRNLKFLGTLLHYCK